MMDKSIIWKQTENFLAQSYDKDQALLQPTVFAGFWPSFVSGSTTEEGIKIMHLMEPL